MSDGRFSERALDSRFAKPPRPCRYVYAWGAERFLQALVQRLRVLPPRPTASRAPQCAKRSLEMDGRACATRVLTRPAYRPIGTDLVRDAAID